MDADGRLEMFGLNDKHRNCIVSYLHFARAQRSQHLKSIDACLAELKASRLATDDTYTIDEVSEMLDSLESVVRAEIESELIYTAHTNVLLINQILRQAETQQVSVDVDVFKLEDRQLLEEVSTFEQSQFPSECESLTKASPLRVNSFDHRLTDIQRIVSLSMEVQKLKQENETLRAGKSDELLTLQLANNSKAESLEAETQSIRMELAEMTKALKMIDLELEKKVSQTTPFKNLKKIMISKNNQLKELRARIAKYEGSSGEGCVD